MNADDRPAVSACANTPLSCARDVRLGSGNWPAEGGTRRVRQLQHLTWNPGHVQGVTCVAAERPAYGWVVTVAGIDGSASGHHGAPAVPIGATRTDRVVVAVART